MQRHEHFGCYGILTLGDCIALIRKARGPYTGLLDLPGGTPEFGEHPDAAVVREIEEELGVEATVTRLAYCDSVVYPYSSAGNQAELHHVGLIYVCATVSTELRSTPDGQDSSGAVWFPLESVTSGVATPFAANAAKFVTALPAAPLTPLDESARSSQPHSPRRSSPRPSSP